MIKDCKMRHENGNCLPAGGFCTANTNICEALQNAYSHGYFEGIQKGFENGGEQKWIPCSERMPEEDGVYLVYAPEYRGGSSSSKEWHDGVMFAKCKNGKWSIEHGYYSRPNCAVAWMPLPKPYEGEC